MDISIRYQGINESPWMNEYLETKLGKLARYLSVGAKISVVLVTESCQNFCELSVKNLKHSYCFRNSGLDLFEAFTNGLEEACRVLRHDYHMTIERVHRKFAEHPDLFGLE